MGDATERLGALLRKAGAVVTFDSARDSSKPCFCCGGADQPRTLEVVGYWTRKVGNRGGPGDAIERPMCAACVAAHETIGRLDIVLSALPHLTGDELRRVAEAMPRVAGEWLDDPEWLVRCYASEDGQRLLHGRSLHSRRRLGGLRPGREHRDVPVAPRGPGGLRRASRAGGGAAVRGGGAGWLSAPFAKSAASRRLRAVRADRDRLRALLAAYGRAVEDACEIERRVALLDIEAEAAKWREWGG